MSVVKLSKEQKKVIKLMREGYYIFENVITPGAKWSIGKDFEGKWGNIHGTVVNGLGDLIVGQKINMAVKMYSLSTKGQIIEL